MPKLTANEKTILYMNCDQILNIELDNLIMDVSFPEPLKKFNVKVSWSQDTDGKFLEEFFIVQDVVNLVKWKNFPKEVWNQLLPEVSTWLMRQHISFKQKQLDII